LLSPWRHFSAYTHGVGSDFSGQRASGMLGESEKLREFQLLNATSESYQKDLELDWLVKNGSMQERHSE